MFESEVFGDLCSADEGSEFFEDISQGIRLMYLESVVRVPDL